MLVPKGDPRQIEIIVRKRSPWWVKVLLTIINVVSLLAMAFMSGLAEAFSKYFLS